MRVTKYVIFHGDELYSQYVGYEKGTGWNINMRSITNTLRLGLIRNMKYNPSLRVLIANICEHADRSDSPLEVGGCPIFQNEDITEASGDCRCHSLLKSLKKEQLIADFIQNVWIHVQPHF